MVEGLVTISNLSNLIQQYIIALLTQNPQGMAEFNRRELADKFRCAPSQINYVLETRFSPDHGFVVESRRGGGGFIRIIRLEERHEPRGQQLWTELSRGVSSKRAEILMNKLIDQGILSEREGALVNRVLQEETAEMNSPFSDVIRAMLMRSVLFVLLNLREG